MSGVCEWRIESTAEPCKSAASFRVSRGQRRHDAQLSCRRHLALTVGALAEGQACDSLSLPRGHNCRFEYCTAAAGECEHPE